MTTKKHNTKKKTISLDLRIFILILVVPIIVLLIIIWIFAVFLSQPNVKDEIAARMAGAYYGDRARSMNDSEWILTPLDNNQYMKNDGFSHEEYIELHDDWQCKTNITFFQGETGDSI